VHQKHLGVYKAPVIEHVQLLKRYFPYLAFNHSGHYQVGRGYDRAKGTIAIYEVFNERRFNSRGNVTDGPKNVPASAALHTPPWPTPSRTSDCGMRRTTVAVGTLFVLLLAGCSSTSREASPGAPPDAVRQALDARTAERLR
jgi:hypothetical protein